MQLTVRPHDLHRASLVLTSVAGRLDDAATDFDRRIAPDVPELGREAAAAAARSAAAVVQAVDVVADDVRQVARALRLLAEAYPQLDSTAVPRRR